MIVSGFLPAISEEKGFIGQSGKAPSIFKVWKGLRTSFWAFKSVQHMDWSGLTLLAMAVRDFFFYKIQGDINESLENLLLYVWRAADLYGCYWTFARKK